MLIRLDGALIEATKVRIEDDVERVPRDTELLGCWYVSLFSLEQQQAILYLHSETRYAVFGLTVRPQVLKSLGGYLQSLLWAQLLADGFYEEDALIACESLGELEFAPFDGAAPLGEIDAIVERARSFAGSLGSGSFVDELLLAASENWREAGVRSVEAFRQALQTDCDAGGLVAAEVEFPGSYAGGTFPRRSYQDYLAATRTKRRERSTDAGPDPLEHARVMTLLDEQLRANFPPELRKTADRLLRSGYERYQLRRLLGCAVASAYFSSESIAPERDLERYREYLALLPNLSFLQS